MVGLESVVVNLTVEILTTLELDLIADIVDLESMVWLKKEGREGKGEGEGKFQGWMKIGEKWKIDIENRNGKWKMEMGMRKEKKTVLLMVVH